jgi:deoxyribodipyrimidine photo-lyase
VQVQKVRLPKELAASNFAHDEINNTFEPKYFFSHMQKNKNIYVHGGRLNALKLLKQAGDKQKQYADNRDFPHKETTKMSAHNKFGTCSIREIYYLFVSSFGVGSTLVKQLFWRDFFTLIANYFPHVFGQAFHEKYNRIAWSDNERSFQRWCQGETGFPIVDAGMRQLNLTGYMHNRVRMIVASFLTKDLHIDWRWGEKYFAQKLVDYDPCVNNGSWQWSASTGCDAQPYFRVFNPWLQQKKFDFDAIYIKTWVNELRDFQPKIIHELYKPNQIISKKYIHPMVDHDNVSKYAKKLFLNINFN